MGGGNGEWWWRDGKHIQLCPGLKYWQAQGTIWSAGDQTLVGCVPYSLCQLSRPHPKLSMPIYPPCLTLTFPKQVFLMLTGPDTIPHGSRSCGCSVLLKTKSNKYIYCLIWGGTGRSWTRLSQAQGFLLCSGITPDDPWGGRYIVLGLYT